MTSFTNASRCLLLRQKSDVNTQLISYPTTYRILVHGPASFFLLLLLFCFVDRVGLSWPVLEVALVDHAGLELTDPLASVS